MRFLLSVASAPLVGTWRVASAAGLTLVAMRGSRSARGTGDASTSGSAPDGAAPGGGRRPRWTGTDVFGCGPFLVRLAVSALQLALSTVARRVRGRHIGRKKG
ncbi:MAG: hypothetical protein JWO31_1580 [Phycisphaerales bacterium]|nr:hypothetical protein [Phycisphaerales bacterium]